MVGLYNAWYEIVWAGVSEEQTPMFSDKLKTRNKLSFFCALFSLFYFFFFLKYSLYTPLIAISIGITLFIAAIVFNKLEKYNLSSAFTILNTNYCVLFFSIYLGFDSGIHLYIFTAPLIVLSLFDRKNKLFIFLSMTAYIATATAIFIGGKYFRLQIADISVECLEIFYIINFACATFFIIMLTFYFLNNNNRVNELLKLKNEELVQQQNQLKEDNIIRKEAEETAKLSLKEREVLLSEIHHRVKNNLAVVTGLMELQSAYITDEKTLAVIKESQNRVKSIALLHEKLYENKTLKQIEIPAYIKELVHFIKQSLHHKEKSIQIHTQIDPIYLEITQAMPFALLLNELINNSYKHAFSNKFKGNIYIELVKNENEYLLNYKDDGIGFNYFDESKKDSLGLNLIESFSKQLNGNFEFLSCTEGIFYRLRFMLDA